MKCRDNLRVSSYLVAPLPLERHGDPEQDGDDPREVDVANDLKEGEREGGTRLQT